MKVKARFTVSWCQGCQAERVGVYRQGKRICATCGSPLLKVAKFKNVPTRSMSGKIKHSRKEARREPHLIALLNAGVIADLEPDPNDPKSRQKEYRLDVYGTPAVEALLEWLDAWLVADPGPSLLRGLVALTRRSKVHVCNWQSDYSYRVVETGELVVEDVKGSRGTLTDVYRLKKKLVLACHGIEIQEVY